MPRHHDTANPYQPPSVATVASPSQTSREDAQRQILWAAIWLMPAVIVNFYFYHTTYRIPPQFGVINLLGTIGAIVAICALLLRLLEGLAVIARALLCPTVNISEWVEILYRSLRWMKWMAIVGSVLWLGWIYLFYIRQAFPLLVTVIAIAVAHTLGAIWYIPLVFQWWRAALLANLHASRE